jgi:hypothetical protein
MGDLLHARLLRIYVAGGAVRNLKEKLQNACADCRYMTRRVAFVSPKNEITKSFRCAGERDHGCPSNFRV